MKLKLIICILFVCLIGSSTHAGENWEQLFNGKNLKGWMLATGKASYVVEDGAIVGTTILNTPNSFLATKKSYSDFILEYDMWLEAEGMNSGVQIRSHQKDDENKSLFGYQVECDGSKRRWTGGIYDEKRHMWLYPLQYNQPAREAFKIGKWNKFRVEAVGNRIRTFINGQAVADLIADYDSEGIIGLQVHSIRKENQAGKKIKWKNIRINTKNPQESMLPESGIKQVSYLKNQLTDREIAEGWKLLWDGNTTKGWRSHKAEKFPEKGWVIEDGILSVQKSDGGESTNGGDIITTKKYSNFILEVDFLITDGANSGIKYFVDPDLNQGAGSAIGCEFQILDDRKHPDARKGVNGNRTTGSCYDLITANARDFDKTLAKKWFYFTRTWARARIEVRNGKVTHHLNGVKVIEYDRYSQMWKALVAYSKYSKWPNFGEAKSGHILLQDHGDKVSFKNIKIKELK